ncbi:CBN-INS-9 protein [Caenorhabditis brenneri]|uniref:CBN-INS-9 protein n=1 Tax=Caenorhabditis brenneri TaxID=135651 RepID=G0MYL2_CAEBE|nr:CBN-INS-9 protein [Caenorhabditis brenneri]
MKISVFLLCLLALTAVAEMFPSDSDFLKPEEEAAEQRQHKHLSHVRSRRFLETVKRRRCGKQIPNAVDIACHGPCNPGTELDMSTICCSNACNYADIRLACCPGRKLPVTTPIPTVTSSEPQDAYPSWLQMLIMIFA